MTTRYDAQHEVQAFLDKNKSGKKKVSKVIKKKSNKKRTQYA